MAQAMDRLKKVRALMLIKHPFFATLMMGMPMIETRDVPTAATDMRSLYINPDFVDTIDDKVLMFVIAHEIMHTALKHGLRKQQRNHLRWNIACDYSINLTLKDDKFTVWDQALLDEKYRGPDKFALSADVIYNLLTKEEDEQKQQGGGQQPGMGEPGGSHHSPMLGDLKDVPGSGDPMAEDALAQDIQQRVAQAAAIARMTGNMSGNLERFVKQVLEPEVSWIDLLRNFMVETTQADEDWSIRNRRFEDIYLPSDHSEAMGELIAIGDASGSCYNDMERYFTEFLSIAEQVNPERIRLIWADTKITNEQEFEAGDDIVIAPKGFGGTDMTVPLKYVEQFEPRVVVLFTDGHTPWPKEEPPYPLIVCCTTDAKCPVGERVQVTV